jgi:hypothetical protein
MRVGTIARCARTGALLLLAIAGAADAQVLYRDWRLLKVPGGAVLFSSDDYEESLGVTQAFSCASGSRTIRMMLFERRGERNDQDGWTRKKGCDALCRRLHGLATIESRRSGFKVEPPSAVQYRDAPWKTAMREVTAELRNKEAFGDMDADVVRQGLKRNAALVQMFQGACAGG